MMKVEITVQHKGNHQASKAQIGALLHSALKAEGKERNGEYKVVSSINHSGSHTDYVLDVPTKKAKTETTDASLQE